MTIQHKINPIPRFLLRELTFVIFRHKWKSLILFSVIALCFLGVAIKLPAIYVSEAQLLLRAGRESMHDPIFKNAGEVSTGAQLTKEQEIRSELQILRSRELTEKIIDRLGTDFILAPTGKKPGLIGGFIQGLKNLTKGLAWDSSSLPPREKATMHLQNLLSIQNPRETSNIVIAFSAEDPKQAHRIVAEAIDVYKAKHLDVHKTPGSLAFFQRQTGLLTLSLKEKEDQLRDFRNQTGITSLPEKQQALLERAIELRMTLFANQAELAAAQARLASLEKRFSQTPEMVITTKTSGGSGWNAAERMRERLFELELKEQELLANYAENSVHVQEIRRQIAKAKAIQKAEAPRDQITRGLNTNFKETEQRLTTERANVAAFAAKAKALDQQWEMIQGELKAMDVNINSGQYSLTQITREIGLIQANLQRYQSNLEQARITAELEKQRISNISVIQPATLPFQPASPNRLMIILVGLILAAAATISMVTFLEFQDQTCKRPIDVEEKLGIPVLATIGRVGRSKTILAQLSAQPPQISPAIKRAILGLRDQVILKGKEEGPTLLGITGCDRGTGTTSVAANLAVALAGSEVGSILLVDANLDHPALHQIFQLPVQPGFTDYLEGTGVEPQSVAPNLEVLAAGNPSPAGANNLAAMAKPEQFSRWAEKYAFVIFDLSPISSTGGPLHLVSLLDTMILAIQAEKSHLDSLAATGEQVGRLDTTLMGAVLNQRQFPIPAWIYRRL